MKNTKLFGVVAAGGASLTVGLAGCGSNNDGDPGGARNTGGAGSTGGSMGDGGGMGGGGGMPGTGGTSVADAAASDVDSGADGAADEGGEMTCDCAAYPPFGWIDCNGTCCWMSNHPCCS